MVGFWVRLVFDSHPAIATGPGSSDRGSLRLALSSSPVSVQFGRVHSVAIFSRFLSQQRKVS